MGPSWYLLQWFASMCVDVCERVWKVLEHNPELWYAYVTNTQLCFLNSGRKRRPAFFARTGRGEPWSFYTRNAQCVADVFSRLLRRFSFRPGLFASTSARFRDRNSCCKGSGVKALGSVSVLTSYGYMKVLPRWILPFWNFYVSVRLLVLHSRIHCCFFRDPITASGTDGKGSRCSCLAVGSSQRFFLEKRTFDWCKGPAWHVW